MNNNNNTSGGIGFVGLLTTVFVVLKLTSVITWSWWWVLSPLWLSALIPLTIFCIVLIGLFIGNVLLGKK